MTPEAWKLPEEPVARVPRTLFSHAHLNNNAGFPPEPMLNTFCDVFMLLPDNWHGTDKIVLWFLGASTEATDVDVVCNAGSCDEAYTLHTATVNNIALALVNGEYECLDITTDFAAWIALLNSRDMLNIRVDNDDEVGVKFIGVEIQET